MSIEAKLLHLQIIQNLLAPYRYLYCIDLEATCDELEEWESPLAFSLRCSTPVGNCSSAVLRNTATSKPIFVRPVTFRNIAHF
jgi:hypothetical protein